MGAAKFLTSSGGHAGMHTMYSRVGTVCQCVACACVCIDDGYTKHYLGARDMYTHYGIIHGAVIQVQGHLRTATFAIIGVPK